MSHTLYNKNGNFCFRMRSSGWFIVIDEDTLNIACRVRSSSNSAYRRVKRLLDFSHSECYRFLTGYKLYVQGYASSSEAAFFCSFLS
jgi:hypothetical protein